MLTLRQIKAAIEDKLEASFPSVTVRRTGVMTNFNRPSFYVRLDSSVSDNRLYNLIRQVSVDIHYFPTDRYQYTLEMLDTQDLLDATFGLFIVIGDRSISLDQNSGDVIDGVLHFTFSFSYLDDQPQPEPAELMQELDFNG